MKPHTLRLLLAALLITSAAGLSAAEPHTEHYVRVVDAAGQAVQYGYICLAPRGLTQRCAAIDPFGPTLFLLPKRVHDATVTVYVPGLEHTEDLRLGHGSGPLLYEVKIPVG
jgi:hypothetical protein